MTDEPLDLVGGSTSLDLATAAVPGVAGVRVRADAAAALLSVHRFVFELVTAAGGGAQVTRDLPNVGSAALTHLGDSGLAEPGRVVAPGDVLIGAVEPKSGLAPLTQEEKLLRAIFGETAGDVRDVSVRCPPGVRGAVVRSEVVPADKQRTRYEVEVVDRRALSVGDVLHVGGEEVVVHAIVEHQAAALEGAVPGGVQCVEKVACAEDALEARAIGPYSPITQQPLSGKRQFGGQRIGAAALALLEFNRAPVVAREMMTIKSDSVSGRTRAYESIVKGEDPEVAGFPESANVLLRVLFAAGIDLELVNENEAAAAPEPGGFFLRPSPALEPTQVRARLPDGARIRERSHGEVQKPETLNYRTFKPENDGLFCSRIFGPVRDYECLCGKYKRMKHRGIVCEKCGVEVIQSRVRRERFGHIELAVPLMHPWASEFVAMSLGLSVDDLRRIVREGLTLGLQTRDPAPPGGVAILGGAEPIEPVGVEALAAAARDTGAEGAFFEVWPVLAPDLRPLVPLGQGRWATSDLNDLYRRLINRNNRTKRLIELNAPEIIIRNEIKMLQEALDALVENGRWGTTLTGPDKRPLASLHTMLAGDDHAHLVGHRNGKRVDYSGAARAVVCDVAPGSVRLPRVMALEIFKPWLYGRLEALGHVTTIKAARRQVERGGPEVLAALEEGTKTHPVVLAGAEFVAGMGVELWDELALGLSAVDLPRTGARAGDVLQVHVPVSRQAIAETKALGALRGCPRPDATDWLAVAAMEADVGPYLFDCARSGVVDLVRDATTRRLFGLAVMAPSVATDGVAAHGDEAGWGAPAGDRAPDAPPSAVAVPWDRAVDELELSIRSSNCLQNAGIQTIGELVTKTEAELLRTKNFGRKSLAEIKQILEAMGLHLGMSGPGQPGPDAPRACDPGGGESGGLDDRSPSVEDLDDLDDLD